MRNGWLRMVPFTERESPKNTATWPLKRPIKTLTSDYGSNVRQVETAGCIFTPHSSLEHRKSSRDDRSRSIVRLGHHTGGIYGDGKGWIVWPAAELEAVIKPNDWNDMRIKVEGNRYVTYLNGVQMIDFTYPSPTATSGVIALQLHSGGEGRMRFKDIYVRDLSRPSQATDRFDGTFSAQAVSS